MFRPRRLAGALVGLLRGGFLSESGWLRSVWEQRSVDKEGKPLPWMTYPVIAFLSPRLRPEFALFEYGAGGSTRWWSERVGSVVSCEHDPAWYAEVLEGLPANVTLRHVPLEGEAYARQVTQCGRSFDLVVIDGRDRVNCARHALSALSPVGVIVWDNSERTHYEDGYRLLMEAGFRRLDFHGMSPLNTYGSTTSIFYRAGNCLGI
jgi:hypothetical protein